jgi:uncharacterized membrane protein
MKTYFIGYLIFVFWGLSVALPALAQDLEVLPDTEIVEGSLQEDFYHGKVVEVIDEQREDVEVGGVRPFVQTVKIKFLEGPRADEEEIIQYSNLIEHQKLKQGQKVVLVMSQSGAYIFDRYRLPALGAIVGLFIILAVIFAGWRGFASLIGLGVTVGVIAFFIMPRIMAGGNPLTVSLIGAFVIATVSIYLAHGLRRRTSVAVVGVLITSVVAILIAQLFVWLAGLTGVGSEEAFHLQTSPVSFVDLRGLLLGSILIGAIGVLDDITTTQVAAVEEIWRANPALSRRELYKRSASVGREHITSLVNTLALAYVGASFPALLLFTVYQRPWWVITNTEAISEEIIRTLVGSIALMFAVPITTLLAVYWIPRQGLMAQSSKVVVGKDNT